MSAIEIAGLGAMNIDHLYQVDEIVADGEQQVLNHLSLSGGSAANTIYGLAKLGVKAGFVGNVGVDEKAQVLIDDFRDVGVDTSQIKAKQEMRTGSVLCLSDKLGGRALYVFPGANDLLTSEDISYKYLNRAKMVHLSSFVNDIQFNIQVDLMKTLKPSVNVNLAPGMLYASKGMRVLAPLLERTHIVFMNREEIERLTGRDFKAGAQECLTRGCQVVVVTLGGGLPVDGDRTITGYICDTNREYEIESEKECLEPQLESTGAGDAFAAGFLFGFLRCKGLEECGLLGDIVARFAIKGIGAREGLPSLSQMSQRFHERTGQQL